MHETLEVWVKILLEVDLCSFIFLSVERLGNPKPQTEEESPLGNILRSSENQKSP